MKTNQQQNEPTPYAKALHADRVAAQEAEHKYPLAGDEGLKEIFSSLHFLDKQLWPAQNGWSEEMQTAIENLHFHKSQILNAVNEHAALCAVAEAAKDVCNSHREHADCQCVDCHLFDTLSALATVRAGKDGVK